MKSTQDFGRYSDFCENVTYDIIAQTVIGGATWRRPCNGRVHRSLVYEFGSNPPSGFGEIAFGAKCDSKPLNARKISNITGGATWERPYIHTNMVDLVYKFE